MSERRKFCGSKENLARTRAIRQETRDLLAQQKTPREVARELVALHGIKRRMADRFVVSVLIELQRDIDLEPLPLVRARIIAGYETCVARLLTKGDELGAARVLNSLAVVRGVVPVTMRDLGDGPPRKQLPNG